MTATRWIAAFTVSVMFSLYCETARAQPVVNSAVNAASFASTAGKPPKLARGGIFTIFGAGIGGSTFAQATAFPLPTELAGSSVKITVNGVTKNAIMSFSTSTQINAILPSDLPSGAGTLTVTYNGQTSAPIPIEVVDHFFGVFTIGSAGIGTAVVTDPLDGNPNTALNLATRPAEDGEIWDIWGTGLGPIEGSDAVAAPLFDQTNVDVRVLVGGIPAQVLFRGRSPCCAGLDQIRFVVPSGVQGCCVTLEVVVEEIAANSVGMSVSQDDRICSRSVFSKFFGDSDIEALLRRGRYSSGGFSAVRTAVLSGPTTGVLSESAFANFQQADFVFAGCGIATDTMTAPTSLPVGDCITTRFDFTFAAKPDFTFSASSVWVWAAFDRDGRFLDEVRFEYDSATPTPPAARRLVEGLFAVAGFRSLDAGPALSLRGPGGNYTLTKSPPPLPFFNYSWSQQQNFTTGIPAGALRPGAHTVSAPGGTDVAAFSFDFDAFAPIQLLNTADFARPIPLNQPLRFAWDSGSSSIALVGVVGSSARSTMPTPTSSLSTSTWFTCSVDFRLGSYSVPVSVLQRLVPSDPAIGGAVAISTAAVRQVAVPGVDFSSAVWADVLSFPASFVAGNAAAIRKPD